MTQMLLAIFAFLMTILFLVTIHEYGHYAMARLFGVKIEKFSVGFGKPIVKWYNPAGVEFSISWIPLGGYVKMYGEEPFETPQSENDTLRSSLTTQNFSDRAPSGKAFYELPAWQRLLIAFAGPAVNLLFTILVFWGVFIIGKEAAKPIIGEIQASSPLFQQGISRGDVISQINDKPIHSEQQATIKLVDSIGDSNTTVEFIHENKTKQATLDLSTLPVGSEASVTQALGFEWAITSDLKALYPAQIGIVVDNTPADIAGLKVNDQILAVNDVSISTWHELTARIVEKQPLTLDVKRGDQFMQLNLVPHAHANNANIGYAGIAPKDIDHEKKSAVIEHYLTIERYGLFSALPKAIASTADNAIFLLKSLAKVITGQFSVKNLGGPISIADYSGKSLQAGWYVYFNYLAMISLTLAVMNLLPIPVLDGGHIVLCAIEMIRGKPLPEKAVGFMMRIGIVILVSFMLMVILLDLTKYLG